MLIRSDSWVKRKILQETSRPSGLWCEGCLRKTETKIQLSTGTLFLSGRKESPVTSVFTSARLLYSKCRQSFRERSVTETSIIVDCRPLSRDSVWQSRRAVVVSEDLQEFSVSSRTRSRTLGGWNPGVCGRSGWENYRLRDTILWNVNIR